MLKVPSLPGLSQERKNVWNVPLYKEFQLSTANDNGVITVPELVRQLSSRDLQTLAGLLGHSVPSQLVSKYDSHFVFSLGLKSGNVYEGQCFKFFLCNCRSYSGFGCKIANIWKSDTNFFGVVLNWEWMNLSLWHRLSFCWTLIFQVGWFFLQLNWDRCIDRYIHCQKFPFFWCLTKSCTVPLIR